MRGSGVELAHVYCTLCLASKDLVKFPARARYHMLVCEGWSPAVRAQFRMSLAVEMVQILELG